MSNASNLGYKHITPFATVNSHYANVSGSNNPASFSSNETMRQTAGGSGRCKTCSMCHRTFCSLTPVAPRAHRAFPRRYYSRSSSRRRRSQQKRRKRRTTQRGGGYHQFGSNQAHNYGYGVGGVLPSTDSALANPPPMVHLYNNNSST